MSWKGAKFATWDDLAVLSSPQWLSSPDALFPASNGIDMIAGSVTKNTLFNGTFRVTTPSTAIVGAAAFNTNGTDIDLTRGAGATLVSAMDPLARDGDNHVNNPFVEFAAVTDTTWNFQLDKVATGAPLWLGEVALVKTWREMPLLMAQFKKHIKVYGHPVEPTRLGHPLTWPSDVRGWVWEGQINKATNYSTILDLYYRSFVLDRPFVFVEEWDVRKVFLCRIDGDALQISLTENIPFITLRIYEVPMGTPPPV